MQRPASCHSVQFAQPEPSMLKVEKTGPASCAPGMDCPFDITISNTGRSDHKGAISITDGLSGAPAMSIASISPPLPCSTQPTDIPFSCKTADDFALSAGDKRTFRVTARIPRSTTERFTNCAIISTLKTVDDDGRNANSSCVTIAPPEKPRTPTTSECRGGMILLPEGECACPAGTTWNGRQCSTGSGGATPSRSDIDVTPPIVDSCPASRPNGQFPNCCPVGTIFINGVCSSGSGGSNTSRPGDDDVCPRSRPVGTPPNCCPTGTRFSNGACRSVIVEPRRCPTGMVGDFPNCCPRGMKYKDGACRPRGDGTGGSNTSKGGDDVCPRSRPVGTPPNCCPEGTRFSNGACRSVIVEPPRCPTGMVGDFPNCCPRGMKFKDGACRPRGDGTGGSNTNKGGDDVCPRSRPVGTPPNCCPEGTRFENGACRSAKKCPAGTSGTFPNCRCPQGMTGAPPNCCPPGTLFQGGKCVRPTTTPPPSTTPPPAKQECTGGKIGRWPNCRCPEGTTSFGGHCRKRATPTPNTPKCTGGKVLTSDKTRCVCPANTQESSGQCVSRVN